MPNNTKQATVVKSGEVRQLNVLGHPFTMLLTSADTQGDSFMFEVISPPGAVVPPHVHQHEDEYGYIAEGIYEVILDGRTYEAKAGGVLHCPRQTSHGFRNIGSTPAKMIWVSTPGANVERFFTDLAALPADAPPDMEKVISIFAKYDIQVAPPPGA
jgi:quercetin dioxygenase-like cupin family protein